MKILAVDDDEISLAMLEHALRQAGHEPLTTSKSTEAMRILHQESVRMVISDWMMPGMSGIELCRWIRSQRFPWYIYIILLTSRGGRADIVEGLSSGADEFLAKPFDPVELDVRIRTGDRILSLETRHLAIFAMAKLAESRDPETGRHLERIREYSRLLAQRLSLHNKFRKTLTPEHIETIYLTSPLHDIGKVGIPDRILLKPGRLTDTEFAAMKLHTVIGGETLGAAAKEYPGVSYLTTAAEIALTHHEQVDGSGYPRGLRGEEIPLCGRIVSVADVYDALTSRRVYKSTLTHEAAKSIILSARGSQFDSEVVDAFLESEDDFVAVANQFYEGQFADSPFGSSGAVLFAK